MCANHILISAPNTHTTIEQCAEATSESVEADAGKDIKICGGKYFDMFTPKTGPDAFISQCYCCSSTDKIEEKDLPTKDDFTTYSRIACDDNQVFIHS